VVSEWPVCVGANPGRVDRGSDRGVGVLPHDVMVLRVELDRDLARDKVLFRLRHSLRSVRRRTAPLQNFIPGKVHI
jgi:hypothetical protein